jgi:hypothetical protein
MPAGLDTARRTAARVAAIRAPYPGTDTLTARTAVPEPPSAPALAPVVHLADRTRREVRDGAHRVSQVAKIDAQNRINLGKVLGPLGWDASTFLVAGPERGHIVVRARADSPLLTRVPVDAGRRLTLPPVVLGALDVRPGQQVQAVGVVDTGELHLVATADALQIFTGPVTAAAPTPAPVARPGSGSRVRSSWRPADGGAHPGR